MDKTMSQKTRAEVLNKLRCRYQSAGLEHKRKLLTQAQELLGYPSKISDPCVGQTGIGIGSATEDRASALLRSGATAALFAADLGGERLRLRAAAGGHV